MKRYIFYNLVKYVNLMIFIVLTIYFYNDLIKKDFSIKLTISNISVERLVKAGKYSSNVQILIQNALPVLNKYKIHILRHPGYWLDIFNTFNQLAVVEKFNGNNRAAIVFLLKSLRYHPFLDTTYEALYNYLKKIEPPESAEACQEFSEQLIVGRNINFNIQKKCIQKAEEIVKKRQGVE